MRAMTATVAISLALILALSAACGLYSRRISEDFRLETQRTAAAIREDRWQEAMDRVRRLERQWEKRSEILAMWVNHGDVDEVSIGFARLRLSIEAEERYHSLRCAEELEEALALIYSRDAFTLKNIL